MYGHTLQCVCVCVCTRSDGIYEYMKRQTGPDSLHLKTDEDLQAFINNYDASIIGMMLPVFPVHTHTDFSQNLCVASSVTSCPIMR